MDKNQTVSGLSMAERREKELLWIDTGENLNQQVYEEDFARNLIRPDRKKRKKGRKSGRSCLLPAERISGLNRR